MSTPPSPTNISTTVNRRRQSHTSRACNYCRKRKTRCDGKHPSCSTCESHGIPCHYSTEKDARKSASKAYVESLKSRIVSLETTLANMGVTSNDESKASVVMAEAIDTPSSPISYPSPAEDSDSKSPGPLMIKESGGLHMYGPTSAYSHLPGRSRPHAGDISSTPSEDSAHDSDSFDWCFNLPTDNNIHLSQHEHDVLLDRFFIFYSSWCLRADRYQFIRGMRRALLSPAPNRGRLLKRSASSRHQGSSRYSPMLHNAILALACTYADDPELAAQDTRDIYGRTAKSMIDQECSRPTLATVEALALLSSYHASKMEDGLFSLHLGMAVRMGEALGLNVNCSGWVRSGHITQQDMVDRVNVFWSIFIQDKLYALFVGRSASIPLSIVTTPLPSVDQRMDEERWTYDGKSNKIAAQPSYLSSTFHETCKASLILTRILDVNYSIKSSTMINRNIMVSDIRVQLDSWYDHLPPKLRVQPNTPYNAMPHLLMLHISYWWFSILLHRPFYPHPDMQQLASKRCDQAADKIVQLFELWRNLYGLRFTPVTAIQAAFAAGTTYLLGAVHSPPGTKRSNEAIKGVRSCIQDLSEMGNTYPAAIQNAEILQNLLSEWAEKLPAEPKLKAELLADRRRERTASSSSPDSSAKSPSSSPQSSTRMHTPKQRPARPASGSSFSSSPPQLGEVIGHSVDHQSASGVAVERWGGSGPGGGGSSSIHPHSQPVPIQQWDPSGFQRVLSDMDAAPFSYNTFGIESASNPFPPLPQTSFAQYNDAQAGYGFMDDGSMGQHYAQYGMTPHHQPPHNHHHAHHSSSGSIGGAGGGGSPESAYPHHHHSHNSNGGGMHQTAGAPTTENQQPSIGMAWNSQSHHSHGQPQPQQHWHNGQWSS